MRQAVLIMAHERMEVLVELLKALDDPRCDVYVHIDRKADFDSKDICSIGQQNIRVLEKWIDARWGDYSLVEVELALIEEALKTGEYSYMHLISGVDYPLHGYDHIHDFCERHVGKEFIGFAQNVGANEIAWRSGRRFLFSRDFKSKSIVKRIIRTVHAKVQSLPGLGRKSDIEIRKGSQWCSFTVDLARYVIENKRRIRKMFKGTYCPDELVMQTLCWNSRFRENVFDTDDEFHGAMRYVPWQNGCLRRLSDADFNAMKSSDAFFGRKFSIEDIKQYCRG